MFAKLFWFCAGMVAYVYAGYPAVLAVLARLWPRREAFEAVTPKVTLLIAAYNEESVIAQKIENSLALDYPRERLQILVTADGSDDATPEVVRRYAAQGVALAYSPERRGKMAAINRAMPLATGDVVVFSDANNLYAADTLREIVKPFASLAVGATSGAKTILKGDGALGDSEGLYWRYESYVKKMETVLGSCTGVVGELFAIRRELFQSPPDGVINDDFYMAMQLIGRGYRVVYVPTARSSERVSLSAEDEVARRSRIVAGRYQALGLLPWGNPLAVWQIVSHKLLRPLVPLMMLGAILGNVGAVWRPSPKGGVRGLGRPWGWLLLLGQGVFYGLAWLGRGERRDGLWGKVLYLPTFLVNSNMAALVGLYRAVTRRQSTLWERVARRDEGGSLDVRERDV